MVDESQAPLRRKLVCILSLDVVGYSRLMGLAEDATHRRVRHLFKNLVVPNVEGYDGRVIKSTGDGILAEFSSIVQGVLCAISIQQEMRDAAARTNDSDIKFRIGVNSGEVIIEPEDIYGDEVNIAVRLQSVAEPGAICVSETVVQHVRERIPVGFYGIGTLNLKNITRPVEAFGIDVPDAPVRSPSQKRLNKARNVRRFLSRPAIAVLPFVNMAPDQEQEYFVDGLTDEVTTGLSRLRVLPVIARSSAFSFKNKVNNPASIGKRLGALYVVEGTVRRSGNVVRVGIRLMDSELRQNIFAEQYDRPVQDVIALQDEISRAVVGEIAPELARYESERVTNLSAFSVSTYDLYQRGVWHHYRYTEEDSRTARSLFQASIESDEDYSPAVSGLAISIVHAAMSGWLPHNGFEDAEKLGSRAVALDARDPQSHFALGVARYHLGEVRSSLKNLERCIQLNPSHAAAHANVGFLHNYLDQPEKALSSLETAFKLSPTDPRQFIWLTALAGALYLKGEYAASLEAGGRGLTLRPSYLHPARYVAASFGQLGRAAEAQTYVEMVRKLDGSLNGTRDILVRAFEPEPLDRILDGLRKAGFED
jgi:TolB-like protein/class 3 adenylate cyclase/Tfp pilus assembly protein PilF